MPSVVPLQSLAGLHAGFFDHLSNMGFASRTVNVPSAECDLRTLLHGIRTPDIVHVMTPLSANMVSDLLGHFPNTRLTAGIDRPSETALWRSALAFAKAAILPHSTFIDAVPRNVRTLAARNRIEELGRQSALHFISPGIDLDRFDPKNDEHIRPFHLRSPGDKAANYWKLQIAGAMRADKHNSNIAYLLPRAKATGGAVQRQGHIERFIEETHYDRHFILDENVPAGLAQKFSGRKVDTTAFVDPSDEVMFRIMLAGVGTAVFLSDWRSHGFADNEMMRGILTFMRYGVMPVVPKYVERRGLVEETILPEGTEKNVWLYPKGFGFFYKPSSYSSIKNAIGIAGAHDFRTTIGHGIFSAVVPNAMTAAMKHGIDAEAAAYAKVFRGLLT